MDKQEEQAVIGRVIAHLNEKTGAHYRADAAANKRHVLARLADGFSEQDLLDVIDGMSAAWADSDFARYLRPETLFRSQGKTESYLQEARRRQKKKAAPAASPGRFRSADDLLEG